MKSKLNLIIIITLFIFCFIIFYKGLSNSNSYSPKIGDKRNVPFFDARYFNSNVYLNSKKIFEEETFYILNIWASWCVPCRKEHPYLMKLSKDNSIKIIGLNYKDNLNNAKKFINELGNPYAIILLDKEGTKSIEWGAFGVPETFLIYKNKIIKRYIGPLNIKLVEEIKNYIE